MEIDDIIDDREKKKLLESMKFYLEESEDAHENLIPIKIDKSLCIKCGRALGGYCLAKNMWIPYTKVCDKYYPKKCLN